METWSHRSLYAAVKYLRVDFFQIVSFRECTKIISGSGGGL